MIVQLGAKKKSRMRRLARRQKKALAKSRSGIVPLIPGTMIMDPAGITPGDPAEIIEAIERPGVRRRRRIRKAKRRKVISKVERPGVRRRRRIRKRIPKRSDVFNMKPTPVKRFKKLPGDRGILQTVKIIKAIVEAFKRSMKFRKLAVDIVKPYKKNMNKIKSIFNWIRANIQYVRDIDDIETLHTPAKILRDGAGDCDDLVILSGVLLKAVGYKLIYVISSNRPDRKFNHIYLIVDDGRNRFFFDPTIAFFNRERSGITRKQKLK